MKIIRKIAALSLTAFAMLYAGCTGKSVGESSGSAPNSEAGRDDVEYQAKISSKGYTGDVRPLTQLRRIESSLGGGGGWVYPVSLAASDHGPLFISDNNAHLIHYCRPDADSIQTLSLQGSAKLSWPGTIQMWRDRILISDNDGLKFFARDGSFERLARVYYQIHHFAVRPDGVIYINPMFRKQKASDPLIVEVDGTGKRLKSFGARLNRANLLGFDDQVYLCAKADVVIAAFQHRPVVRIYSTAGDFIREFNVSHPSFSGLDTLGKDQSFSHPGPDKYRLPTYLSGARIIGERLFILLDLPQPEIVEFDFNGAEMNRYRAALPSLAKAYRGFDVRRINGRYVFWLIASDRQDSASLIELAS